MLDRGVEGRATEGRARHHRLTSGVLGGCGVGREPCVTLSGPNRSKSVDLCVIDIICVRHLVEEPNMSTPQKGSGREDLTYPPSGNGAGT